ncbi:uncharacterized protein UV8b_01453 [Ustilaginoidea virens]|uniref:Uncharacterized protein n=1 Tax=Ustilaginoidea virens TaxID=1159556 RepID=A0A8E5MFA1_USTVR|nr:uncharacterized protein UV8b_01453 [Ustilaginoidea virens]QUC17212.1 hypothetical protein UV8b_01453 [Ustilaginoidea virens]
MTGEYTATANAPQAVPNGGELLPEAAASSSSDSLLQLSPIKRLKSGTVTGTDTWALGFGIGFRKHTQLPAKDEDEDLFFFADATLTATGKKTRHRATWNPLIDAIVRPRQTKLGYLLRSQGPRSYLGLFRDERSRYIVPASHLCVTSPWRPTCS